MQSSVYRPFRFVLASLLVSIMGALVNLPGTASAADQDSPQDSIVRIETELGHITLELYESKAPITVVNFLRYVDAKAYDGATFYRTVRLDNQAASDVPIQVIQGGVHGASLRGAATEPPQKFPPIEHETTDKTGVRHVDGAISMARGAPGSATSEFFICIGDNPALDFGGRRNPDGQGFAAFGRVIEGMDVVHQIHRRPSGDPSTEGASAMKGQVISQPVKIISVRRGG